MNHIDKYKLFLKEIEENKITLQEIEQSLSIKDLQEKLQLSNQELSDESIWADQTKMASLSKEVRSLEKTISSFLHLQKKYQDIVEFFSQITEEDVDSLELLEGEYDEFKKELDSLNITTLFSGEHDKNNCFLEIHPGSGGTEAQDWAEMLMRMYSMWTNKNGFELEVEDVSKGDVAGIKDATLLIKGEFAYGYLKRETGIHRLVRKSPFDSGNRRHTSFASVFVSPELDDTISIDINPADLLIETYRSGGAGGQHVNKTDSAVRITHIPTKVVAQCQSERSQHQNKASAMSQLKSKLYQLEIKKKNAIKDQLESSKDDISWGNQIRSYVLDSSRIKDLRTNVEVSSCQSVLDGDINEFLLASLKTLKEPM